MPARSELIASIARLPIAEKAQEGRLYSKEFWEVVFEQLKSFPISILAGNLFIQNSTDPQTTIEARLKYFIDLYKKYHRKNDTIAILGEWEYSHPHRKLIKSGLRSAGIRVLTGSEKHHLHLVRVKATAKHSSQTIGIVGLSGKYVGMFMPDTSDEQQESSIAICSPTDILDTFLLETTNRQDIDRIVVVLPTPITPEIAVVCERYKEKVSVIISGAAPDNKLSYSADFLSSVPHYYVTVPSPFELSQREYDEVRPENLFTMICLPTPRS